MADLSMEEDEDWLTVVEPPDAGAKKKRQKKVVTLDDLLQANDKEAVRKLKAKAKSHKLVKSKSNLYLSSEDEDEGVHAPKLRQDIDDLEKQIVGAGEEEVELEWGAPIFAAPLKFPSLVHSDLFA